jgi:glycerol uptake facilitator-like aquaporin
MGRDLGRRAAAEALGTGLLLAIVVGSGVMAARLSPENTGVALLANALATGAGLFVLASTLGPVSGGHFNPLVTAVAVGTGRLPRADGWFYGLAQCAGGVAGVWLAHAMFGLAIVQVSTHARDGAGQWISEGVATAGLLLTLERAARHRPEQTPLLVMCWVVAAYWFTASTAFANPAVTLARAWTDTFAGIRPADVPGFVGAQAAGAAAGWALARALDPQRQE